MNKIQFKTRKDVSAFLKEKNIDTTYWSEEKWLNIDKSGAEIHIQALAESMWDARNESTPQELKAGEWHIPFGENLNKQFINISEQIPSEATIKISTARCARLSYMTFDGDIDYQKDIDMHDKLLKDRHGSPFEHCARTMTEEEYYTYTKGQATYIDSEGMNLGYQYFPESANGWCDNFRGFVSYRKLLGI